MNKAGPITDLAVREDTFKQPCKSTHSLKGYKSLLSFTWLTERGDQQGLVTEALFQAGTTKTKLLFQLAKIWLPQQRDYPYYANYECGAGKEFIQWELIT